MRRRICLVLMLALCMVGCANEGEKENLGEKNEVGSLNVKVESDITKRTEVSKDEPTPIPVVTDVPKTTPSEDVYVGSEGEICTDTAIFIMPKLVSSGEITGYAQGTTKFLVWKYAPSGIKTVNEYKFAIMDCHGEYESEYFSYDEYIENPQQIVCLGSNIFEVTKVDSKVLYHNIERGCVFFLDNKYIIKNGFYDGYAVGYVNQAAYAEAKGKNGYSYHELVLIKDNGEVIKTPLYFRNGVQGGKYVEVNVGLYNEGYFFLENAFYDLNWNKVLDFGDMEVTNAPFFDGGCCWLEYKEANSIWGVYMDTEGQFLEEPSKLYDVQ